MAFELAPQAHFSFSSDSNRNTGSCSVWSLNLMPFGPELPCYLSLFFKPQNLHWNWRKHLSSCTSNYEVTLLTMGLTSHHNCVSQLPNPKWSSRLFLLVLLSCWLQPVLLFWRTLMDTRFFHVAMENFFSISHIKLNCIVCPILGYGFPIFVINNSNATMIRLIPNNSIV